MQTLRFYKLRTRVCVRPGPSSRASRRREALRMVWIIKLRARMRVWSRPLTPARSGWQQVYLVRFDIQWLGLPILPYAAPREVKIFGDRPRREPALQGVYASGSCRSLLCEPLFAASHLPRSDFMSPINPVLVTPHIAISVVGCYDRHCR